MIHKQVEKQSPVDDQSIPMLSSETLSSTSSLSSETTLEVNTTLYHESSSATTEFPKSSSDFEQNATSSAIITDPNQSITPINFNEGSQGGAPSKTKTTASKTGLFSDNKYASVRTSIRRGNKSLGDLTNKKPRTRISDVLNDAESPDSIDSIISELTTQPNPI
ncbi:hypothetical protein [Legionella sp. W05-934-2]|uniref:hypothetical protein n=1 Tax=Legionella sp. W05-934-2 TaxID=1198649 RepID=UPI003461EF7D